MDASPRKRRLYLNTKKQGLSRQEQADDYAGYISRISREYTPLTRAVLPERLSYALENAVCSGHPHVDELQTYKVLSERKLTGGVDGDLDPRITKDCMVELSFPMSCVYKESLDSHIWPAR